MVVTKSRNFVKLFYINLITFFILSTVVFAQTDPKQQVLAHVCVLPKDGSTPYLISFRNTDLTNNTVGFALPIATDIVIYGTEATNAYFGIYNIAPDAETGSYRLAGKVISGLTRTDIERSDACAVEYPDVITEDNPTSTSQQLTSNQIVVLQFSPFLPPSNETTDGEEIQVLPPDDLVIPPTPILGVFSIHFRPNLDPTTLDIQLIQMSPGGIEVSFPGIQAETTRFVAIGNKDFGVQITFADFPSEPLLPIPANPRSNFRRLLARQRFPIDSENSLDLFTMMNDAKLRFYPFGGVIYEYPAQGFIRIDTAPGQSKREPPFAPGTTITPIDGAAPFYLAPENSEPRQMGVADEARIVEINADGQLIVSGGRVGTGAIVDAWLVQVKAEQ